MFLERCSWSDVPGAMFLERCSWSDVPGAGRLACHLWQNSLHQQIIISRCLMSMHKLIPRAPISADHVTTHGGRFSHMAVPLTGYNTVRVYIYICKYIHMQRTRDEEKRLDLDREVCCVCVRIYMYVCVHMQVFLNARHSSWGNEKICMCTHIRTYAWHNLYAHIHTYTCRRKP